MIHDLLTGIGKRKLIAAPGLTYKLPFTINNANLAITDSAKDIIDLKRGIYLKTTSDDLKLRAFGTHQDLGNTLPLSLVYLSALVVKDPFLPDEILVDADKAPSIYIRNFTDANYKISNSSSSSYIWIFPEGGIEHITRSGYYYIPAFPDYVIDVNGKVINVYDGSAIEPDIRDIRKITLTDGDGSIRSVDIKYLVVMAFGKYDKSLSSDVFFLDNDDTNFSHNNIFTKIEVSENLSVTLHPDQENNVANY